MDIYTKNGNIIRQFPNNDGTTEVEIELLFQDSFWTRLYALTAFYVAFRRRLDVDYVVVNHTHTRVVLRQEDLDEDAQHALIDALVEVGDHSNRLRALAEKHLFGNPHLGQIETNRLEALKPYKKTEVQGRDFLETFANSLDE